MRGVIAAGFASCLSALVKALPLLGIAPTLFAQQRVRVSEILPITEVSEALRLTRNPREETTGAADEAVADLIKVCVPKAGAYIVVAMRLDGVKKRML